jgi:hypothetical protein
MSKYDRCIHITNDPNCGDPCNAAELAHCIADDATPPDPRCMLIHHPFKPPTNTKATPQTHYEILTRRGEVMGGCMERDREYAAQQDPGASFRPSQPKDCGHKATPQTEERIDAEAELRRWWWLGHGCTSMYGDDGEMQCASGKHPILDFKRMSLASLREEVLACKMRMLAATPPQSGSGEVERVTWNSDTASFLQAVRFSDGYRAARDRASDLLDYRDELQDENARLKRELEEASELQQRLDFMIVQWSDFLHIVNTKSIGSQWVATAERLTDAVNRFSEEHRESASLRALVHKMREGIERALSREIEVK